METARHFIKFTYEDYLLVPEDRRVELMDGEFYMVPSPGEYHQRLSGKLEFRLRKFIEERDLGFLYYAPFDVVLSENDVVQPDILFISKHRKGIITPDNVRGAPDLVIEILSPNTSKRDRITKKRLYSKYGVREYWIADPDSQSIEVLFFGDTGLEVFQVFPRESILRSPLLPGLEMDLREIFEPASSDSVSSTQA